MSEMVWCNIKVKVPNSWNILAPTDSDPLGFDPPAFIAFLGEHGLVNGCGPDVDEEGPDWTIWMCDGEGNYGLSDSDVEPFLDSLREHNVPFVAIEDAKYEWLGSYVWNDGTDERSSEYAGENIVLPESTYRDWLDGLAPDDLLGLADKLHAFFDVGSPPLSELSIAHLPAECPLKTEES